MILTLPSAIRKMPAHGSPSQNSISPAAKRRSTALCASAAISFSPSPANSGICEISSVLGTNPYGSAAGPEIYFPALSDQGGTIPFTRA